jgi:hypothetical protein
VVAMGGSVSSRAAVRGSGRAAPAPEASALSRIPISVISLIVAVGVFVSSIGYADGRAGAGTHSVPGIRLFWLGQVLILVPVAARLLSRRHLSNGNTVMLIAVLTVAEYLIKVNYTPLGFAFNDEFLHWRNTTNMLATGKLFEQNYGLPVGTYYPGLEEVTSALVSATGLSVFEAGLIVAGIAHLLFICFLYLAFCVAIRSHRIAGIAVLLYSATPSLTSFNSMFVYETPALAFLAMCIVAGLRSATDRSPNERRRWFIIAVLCILATVITHHVTSYMLTAFLILVAVASRLTGSRNTAVRFGILATISATSVILWIATLGRGTISYFSPTVLGIVNGINSLSKSGDAEAPNVGTTPFSNQVLQYVGLLVITVLIVVGCWQAWRRHRRHPWIIGMMIGCLGFFGFIAIRLATPDGQELAGRAATYTYIPVSVLAALALTRLVNSGTVRRWGGVVTAVVLVAVVTLIIDGLANGWPPYWERLPGPHQVSSFESSVGPEEIATADWTLQYLGSGNRIAADAGIYPVLLGYGDQDALQDISVLYDTPTWTAPISGAASGLNVQYVLTDNRLTQLLPLNGTYFPGDTTFVTKTLPLANLTKFNHITGVARVFDDGNINIYYLQSLGYVPQTP